ncbi:uncharacterized protein LOC112053211 [Bicyclus anynana]|uniref:Uncharacterized protein LOC112053211 n=1 Tax=Bicyclus anynana TaxID=110368 RepID=A0ABM3LLK8_BICAN|nr:uncharacterized protein LOC112053211 [Bicyclus anynana]
MATMIKEKRREKKKTKNKHSSETEFDGKENLESQVLSDTSDKCNDIQASTSIIERQSSTHDIVGDTLATTLTEYDQVHNPEQLITSISTESGLNKTVHTVNQGIEEQGVTVNDVTNEMNNVVLEAKTNLEDVVSFRTSVLQENNTQEKKKNISKVQKSITSNEVVEQDLTLNSSSVPNILYPKEVMLAEDIVIPSAPLAPIEIESQPYVMPCESVVKRDKVTCMPLEEAVRVFGGKEIAEVKDLSQKEEALVELGPQSGPDHPLVDLLSTFRTSLISIERERNRISCGYASEEKSRSGLWAVEKRWANVSERCACGAEVSVCAQYEIATLRTEKLPAARLRLDALLRDVRDCYCHHQHAALQAHYDVDELMGEILKGNKGGVREALLLVLQALQLSDAAPDAYAAALQRWASVLTSSLLDQRDLRQLLFLLHCLFRQTRSVQWAARVVRLQCADAAAAARLLAVLELLLAGPLLEQAHECTEEAEAWEEVDVRGEGGGVAEGRLRERDVLALLDALPLRHVLARLLLFHRPDIEQEDAQSWGGRGGRGVLRACCGVRALLSVLRRAAHAHAHYGRLRARLRALAAAALHGLAALHLHCRESYEQHLRERIAAELEACFAAGLDAPGEGRAPPAALLSAAAAADYCLALTRGLHEDAPLRVESLSASTPRASCALRVRAAAQAALDRELDHGLAARVLDFLFQVGIKNKSSCAGACDASARALLPRLLALHRLHTGALHMLADLYQVSSVPAALLEPLAPQQWRPAPGELRALLDDWAARCAPLLQPLLERLDYTPHTGLSLESQLVVGSWLCAWLRGREAPDWAWRVLRAVHVHRSEWGLPLHAPPPEPADDLLAAAFALLASDWGHCLPLVCGPGAAALARLAGVRPRDALHCAAPLMRVMAQSPESVSLTPTFAEVFTTILNSGPSLVARALGRREPSAQELLQQLLLQHVQDDRMSAQERSAVLSAWLHALWRPGVPAGARAALDAAVRAARDWRTLDAHARAMLQEENAKELLVDAVRHVAAAPLLCEAALRHAHARELHTHAHARLADELARQRVAGQKIHVDNALKQIGSSLSHDELALSRCAGAALAAAPQHPAHLLLWRLLLHMYLQRPPSAPPESSLPVGPMLFSGLVKSRTLSQLKKRLQETAVYHRTQAELLKTKHGNIISPSTSESCMEKKSNPTSDNSLFSPLAINDLTGGSDLESDDSLSDEDGNRAGDRGVRETSADGDTHHLMCYHTAAEKIVREYLLWLEEGERVRAAPHHADVARFLSEQMNNVQALDTAWRCSLSNESRSPASPASPPADPQPPPADPQLSEPEWPPPHTTHCERALRALAQVERKKRRRYNIPNLSTIDEVYLRDAQAAVGMIQKHLAELEQLTKEWSSELQRVSKLDAQLWELLARLRVRRPLPPVRRACAQGCKPLTVHIAKDEWCISTGAEQGIQENRRSACAALRRLARARPRVARLTSRLRGIGSRVRSPAAAQRACELAASAAPRVEPYAPARDAVGALVDDLAARFICADAALAATYLSRWSAGDDAQRRLCALLVRPARLPPRAWPALYAAVLALPLPPHVAFSYLSKFELAPWADAADASARGAVLDALLAAARRLGPQPDDQQLMLLELVGVHSLSAVRGAELCAHVLRCAGAALAAALPPLYLQHLAPAVDKYGEDVDFDELGHCLRQLGASFWSARRDGEAARRALLAAYAPHFADALYALLRAFVGAGLARTYEPARVSLYAWSALCETWPAWLLPHGGALLSLAHPDPFHYSLARFGDALDMLMRECPDCEDVVLRQVFEWALRAYPCAEHRCSQEARAQLAALLARLAALPWARQWFSVHLLDLCIQVSRSMEQELASWCGVRLQHQRAGAWLHDAPDEHLPHTLPLLLELFTCQRLALPRTTLAEAARLPWWRLSEAALGEALARYVAAHHSPALPYHEAPHFDLMLTVCQLKAAEDPRTLQHPQAGDKRAAAVSQWVRAAAAPALAPHVPAHTARLLRALADLAPYVEETELEHLLSRAAVALCIQPVADGAAPVWLQWAGECPARARRALAAAAGSLTALPQFAALGDAVARATLADEEGGGWRALSGRWAACPWRECGPLLARGALHAAYGTLLAHAHAPDQLRQAFAALLAAEHHFARDELVAAVWVCVAARAAGTAGAAGEAARALLLRWAEQRRSLLQLVTLHAASSCPTPQLRVLLRLALCVVSPSEGARQAYEQACEALPAAAHARAWARDECPAPALLPRLAASLYPGREVYFKEELEMATSL